jgi:hypothetical protein
MAHGTTNADEMLHSVKESLAVGRSLHRRGLSAEGRLFPCTNDALYTISFVATDWRQRGLGEGGIVGQRNVAVGPHRFERRVDAHYIVAKDHLPVPFPYINLKEKSSPQARWLSSLKLELLYQVARDYPRGNGILILPLYVIGNQMNGGQS